MLLLLASAAAAAAPPRVAVWGGSGFLGSRVARTLVDAGCSVVSLSRTGKPPPWAERQAWAEQVSWQRADALGEDALAPRMGRIDAAVSCIGNMRPSTEWEGFFGLHWDYETMLRENGDVNERVAEAARQAGARRFTLVSVASVTKWAYGGALEGYIDGKLEGERAVLRLFGDANSCFVGPTLLYGGARFAGAGKLLATVCDTPALRGQIAFFKWLKGNAATGYAPNDAAGEVATTPPCDVDVVARAVCACVLGTTPLSKLSESHAAQQLREDVIRFDVEAPDEMLDRPFPALPRPAPPCPTLPHPAPPHPIPSRPIPSRCRRPTRCSTAPSPPSTRPRTSTARTRSTRWPPPPPRRSSSAQPPHRACAKVASCPPQTLPRRNSAARPRRSRHCASETRRARRARRRRRTSR